MANRHVKRTWREEGELCGQAVAAIQSLSSSSRSPLWRIGGARPSNDNYGHAAGGLMLRITVERLQECIRGNDTVARLAR